MYKEKSTPTTTADLATLRDLADKQAELSDEVRSRVSLGEYRARKLFETDWSNVPLKLMLVVSELGEAVEAYRHMLIVGTGGDSQPRYPTDADPWYSNFGEEIADAIIRLLDLAASLDLDIERRICEKMALNEARPARHGKTC